jgi:D-3-phosphoglycerate dehydrogenase
MLRSLSRRRFSSVVDEEIKALEQKLATLKASRTTSAAAPQEQKECSDAEKFVIGTFNAISKVGLQKYPTSRYTIAPMEKNAPKEPHAIMLRSHKLTSEQVPTSVRAVARCGSGVNNIPVDQMTLRGIPVFNTPGANANAVKELTVCALLLASRGILDGINHVKQIYVEDGTDKEKVKKRVEAEKKFFVGQEMKGKRLGVIGLGFIGSSVAEVALSMGMEVTGYDPMLTVETAWRLQGNLMNRSTSLDELLETSDYISLHVPYSKSSTHHMLDATRLAKLKKNCHIVNFARGELIDTKALRALMDSNARTGKYVCDFPDEHIQNHKLCVTMPHLGASTEEAEENAASMAAQEIVEFIETGEIRNSVNFPTTILDRVGGGSRLCVVNRNVPGMLGLITSTVGAAGMNIVQHINTSRDQIAYNVVDLANMPSPEAAKKLQQELQQIDGVVSSRLIQAESGPAGSQRRRPGFFVVTPSQ